MPPIATADVHASRGSVAAEPALRFPTFEGLRALCALAVLAFHAATLTGLITGERTTTVAGRWMQHLNVGVSIFFVLSGFLLFRPFVAAHLAGASPPAVGRYLRRRLVRIFPAYWLALAVSTPLLHLRLGDWWGHVRYYGLLQIYWGDTVLGGLVQAWSLCTELSFYLFLPLWAAALARVGGSVERRIRAQYVGCAVLYASGLVFRAGLRAGDHAVGYAWLPANTDLFALGMALAVAHAAASARGRPPDGLARTIGDLPGAAWIAALCCYGAVVALRYPYGFDPPTVVQEVGRQLLFGLVAVLVVAPGVFGPQGRGLVRRVLRWRPLWAVGVVSYGVYLWHLTLMERLVTHLGGRRAGGVVVRFPSWWGLTAASTVAAVAVAGASWFVLERPLLRWARRRGTPAPPGPPNRAISPDVLRSRPESAPARVREPGRGEERT